MNRSSADPRAFRAPLALLCATALLACGGDDPAAEPGPDPTPTPDAGAPEGDVMTPPPETADRPIGGERPRTTVYIARQFIFEEIDDDGVSAGFNLDAHVTSGGGEAGCGQPDFIDPDGTEGIDNQFGTLLPIIASLGGAALPTLVQSAINEGDLLLLVTFDNVDDWMNDDNITITISRGVGDPIIGADGMLTSWQTFGQDAAEPINVVADGRIVDGVLTAGPASLDLPVFVFTFRFDVTLHGSMIRGQMSPEGPLDLLTGGSITLDNVMDIARTDGIQAIIPATIESLGPQLTDMTVFEPCDSFSASARLVLSPAWMLP
jgi:hypothetical protein